MIQLTKTQKRALDGFLADGNEAQAGVNAVMAEAGITDGSMYEYNPITGVFTEKELEPVVLDKSAKVR